MFLARNCLSGHQRLPESRQHCSYCKRVGRASLHSHHTFPYKVPRTTESEEPDHASLVAALWKFNGVTHSQIYQLIFSKHFGAFLPPFEVVLSFDTPDKAEDPSMIVEKEVMKSVSSSIKNEHASLPCCQCGENIIKVAPSGQIDTDGEINMEACVMADDVLRAGGFGARDDIGSFLSVASDSTDFEATIRNAQDYEEPQQKICRPGLGWKEARKTE